MEPIAIYMLSLIALTLLLLYWHSEKRRQKGQPIHADTPAEAVDIVGKSTTVFLEPIPKTRDGEPFMNQPLEREHESAVTEPDVSPDEVETNLQPQDLQDPDDIESPSGDDDDFDPSDELSQGLTFEQIGHAVDVVEKSSASPEDELKAGETLAGMPADMLEFITKQESNLVRVMALIDGFSDNARIRTPKPVKDFDINDFV